MFVDKVTPNKRLLGGVEFIPEIPKNNVGKVLRRTIRELWNKQQSDMSGSGEMNSLICPEVVK